ncbi:MAG TPA: endopeptidase La [Candidatus Xenobia bacterium]|jgi:ATP-dependent Lon protease
MSDNRLPLVPLRNTVLFPTQIMPLVVGRPASAAAVDVAARSDEKTLVVVTQRDPTQDQPGLNDLYPVGVKAVIRRAGRGDHGLEIVVVGIEPVRLLDLIRRDNHVEALFEPHAVVRESGAEVEALGRSVAELASTLLNRNGQHVSGEQLRSQIEDPLNLVYLLPSLIKLPAERLQAWLESPSLQAALNLALTDVSQEQQVLNLREQIASQVESKLDKERKEYLLRQQLRAIQQELGETDEGEAETASLRDKLDKADLPESVLKEALRELKRMEKLPPAAPDYGVIRTWIDLVTELPWKKSAQHVLDLKAAAHILDDDHYGLSEIKDRILEHLAVMKLNPQARSPILCLVGPPGVGKTSLGQSIARALGRPFERTSLGGLHDEAELRGHRRTYVGAMAGRLIQAVRRAGVNNPVLMLDEVDKLGRDFRGDPAAALMEILDPAQNKEFRDNYLDLPFDLSHTFFILTANTLDGIPRPLLDRMEVLRLSGYSDEEKAEIAARYLLPRQIKECGLSDAAVVVPRATVIDIIRHYTREAGLRQLERALGRLMRKTARRLAEEASNDGLEITPDLLTDMLGTERRPDDDRRREVPPGVATGLAWTETGGDVLYVEALPLTGGDALTITGQLGDVMQESARTARSYVLSRSRDVEIPGYRLREPAVHIHVPAGATPKDGPSAGVTMATALLSAWSGVPTRQDVAMTGEITLTGLVLPVGGIKEKVLAAHRTGIRTVVLPRANERDIKSLSDEVRRDMTFMLADTLDDVWRVALPGALRTLRLAS